MTPREAIFGHVIKKTTQTTYFKSNGLFGRWRACWGHILEKDMSKYNTREYVMKYGMHRKGMKDLCNHFDGKRLTQRQAIQAHCYDCLGLGDSTECVSERCPLRPYSQFGGLKKSYKAEDE